MKNNVIQVLQGHEILPYLQLVAELRITFFREYPYLYEGDFQTERKYLSFFASSEKSIFVLAFDQNKVVGAITGIPLDDMKGEIKNPFLQHGGSLDGIYYLGDIIVLKKHRKKGLGKEMYQLFESAVQKMGGFQQITFCEIERDPASAPADYFSLDDFWAARNYVRDPSLKTVIPWLDIGQKKPTDHTLVFWSKTL